MVDVLQIVLVMVATVVTVLTVLIGIQVFKILAEVRESIRKFNRIIDSVSSVADSVVRPISSLSELVTGFTGAGGLLSWFLDRKRGVGRKEAGGEGEEE